MAEGTRRLRQQGQEARPLGRCRRFLRAFEGTELCIDSFQRLSTLSSRIHTARKIMEFFEQENIAILLWPANSLDINPIEHVWAYIKRSLDRYLEAPKNLDELWERVQVIWQKNPNDFLQKLYESMPNCLEEVIRNKGGNIKY